MADEPNLVTVPNVELLEVGEDWSTSTGVFSFTPEDLVAAIESQDDPGVRSPIVKLGHVDPRFDGQPSLGRVENLRLENNGQTLVGDLVGVPVWLAKVMRSAYPRRSIEGAFQYHTQTGNDWPFVLTGLALLGDSYPAIDTLEDIQLLWGNEMPKMYPADELQEVVAKDEDAGVFFRARRMDMPKWQGKPEEVQASGTNVRAALSLDEVRRAYYDTLDAGQMWWWIREVRVNPLELIVDDDAGNLYRVAVTVSGSDEVTFGEPQAVKVEYVDASAGQLVAAAYKAPTETGRPVRSETAKSGDTMTQESHQRTEEITMQLTDEVREKLGLGADASEDDINAAILQLAQQGGTDGDPQSQPETPATDPAGEPAGAPAEEEDPAGDTGATTASSVQIPEGMTLIDEATLTELRTGVAAARQLQEEKATEERNKFLEQAVRAGKFPKARRPHYEKAWAADPAGTRQLIDSLAPGLVPVEEVGKVGNETDTSVEATAYPTSWGGSVAAAKRGIGSRVKVVGD